MTILDVINELSKGGNDGMMMISVRSREEEEEQGKSTAAEHAFVSLHLWAPPFVFWILASLSLSLPWMCNLVCTPMILVMIMAIMVLAF